MAKIKEIKINRFDGGISDDIREPSPNKFSVTKHFDIYTNPYRLTPNRDQEDDMNDGSSSTGMKTYKVTDIIPGSDGKLYASGQNQPTNTRTKLFYKADPTDGNWTKPASATGNSAQIAGCLVEFENYFWGFQGTNQIFKYGDITGVPTITDSAATVASTITSVAQGVIAKDKSLYLFYNNIVVRVATGGSVTDSALTLPSDLKITSVDVYGNYLAIGCAKKNTNDVGRSTVFLWDLVSSDVSETIDWGEGALLVLGNIEGRLIGVTSRYLSSTLAAKAGSMVVREWAGGTPSVVKEIKANDNTGTIKANKFTRGNKLYWMARIPNENISGLEGIWCYGRKNVDSPFALTVDMVQEGADSFGLLNFGMMGNYTYIVYSTDYSISKTDDQLSTAYSFTSIYESQRFGGGDIDTDKQLRSIAVTFAPLGTNGSVTLKYRKDEETSYTTIGTESTDSAISHVFVNIESSGAVLPTFKEIQFRIESTGGAEITGFKFKYEETEDIYG